MTKTVLIVDDDPVIRLVIQKMIHAMDHSVKCHQCTNGELGLTALETLQKSTNNIVVFLDINMPILNGWEFLDRLKKLNTDTFDTFELYIISSSTDEGDKFKAKSYPVIRKFYHKPLSKQDIREILN